MSATTKQRKRFFLTLIIFFLCFFSGFGQKKIIITEEAPKTIDLSYFGVEIPKSGDTIFISSNRKKGIKFKNLSGNAQSPIVVINYCGQVNISDSTFWGALTFENCKFIKVTGTGDATSKYGFKLSAQTCGLAFTEYSSDCEAEFIEIDHDGFFGVYAKKDFSGNPPFPYPVFDKLVIHDLSIRNVSVGMYLGETKSPGMVFKHVRVYNNLVVNTGREGIQVANMIEDVEVFNNTIVGSGNDHETFQGNNFQIGDNCVGKYFNNVFIDAPANGMIIMGSGNIEVCNNYFENNMGVFVDNRQFTTPLAPIILRNNYFTRINNTQIIRNMNEINPMMVSGNNYDGTSPFMLANDLKSANLKVNGNQHTTIQPVVFQDTIHHEILPVSLYFKTTNGTCSAFNYWPVIEPIAETYVFAGDTLVIPVRASVPDGDMLDFSTDSLPGFITFTDSVNGQAELGVKALANNIGTYEFITMVTDHSHQVSDRMKVRLIVALRTNQAPVIQPIEIQDANCLTETIVPVIFSDADHDQIIPRLVNAPAFVQIESISNQTFQLRIKPKFLDKGIFNFQIAYTDSHSPEIMYQVQINIGQAILLPNIPLYRLNCGGPELTVVGLNWESVLSSNSGKRYVVTHSYETGSHTYKGINNTTAPNNVFGPYSFDYPGGTELKWKFPLPNGKYKVNLFFRERKADIDFDGSKAIFNVLLETNKILSNFCIYDENGEDPLQKSFETIVKDKSLNIDFEQIAGKPKISGIEIIFLEPGNEAPSISKIPDVIINEGDSLYIPLNIMDDRFSPYTNLVFATKNFPSFVKLINENNNAGISITPDYNEASNYSNLWVKVSDGDLSDSISVNLTVNDKNRPNFPFFTNTNSITVPEGSIATLTILATDPEGDAIKLSLNNNDFISVILDQSTQSLIFNPDFYSSGTYKITVSATDDKYHCTVDTIQVTIPNVNPRIILTPEMIVDEVVGKSVDSPKYLVDEQTLSVEKKEHPISKSWRPYYTSAKAPYSVTIDLGAVYSLTRICFHDMNASEALVISIGQPGNWTPLYTETLNTYINWKVKDVSVNTRYIRLTMQAGSSAYTNEIALFGQLCLDTIPSPSFKSANILNTASELIEQPRKDEIKVFPTIILEAINLQISNSSSEEYKVFLYNSLGEQLISDHFFHTEMTEKAYPVDRLNLSSGQYFMKVQNQKGKVQTFKLIKT